MIVAISVAPCAAQAATADLVTHKSFEACWSQALTQNDFAAELNAAVEGHAGCIVATGDAGNSKCMKSTCAGNVPGCPITLHAGTVVPGYASLLDGYASFDAGSGIDPFAMDVVINGYDCTVTITDTSTVVTTLRMVFQVTDDGNFGLYMAGPLSVSNTATTGLSGSDYALSGDLFCTISGGLLSASTIQTIIADGVRDSTWYAEQAAIGESVCP